MIINGLSILKHYVHYSNNQQPKNHNTPFLNCRAQQVVGTPSIHAPSISGTSEAYLHIYGIVLYTYLIRSQMPMCILYPMLPVTFLLGN